MLRLINTLTGRFLVLTVIFVMLAEVLIFLPSVARFRLDYLQERLELSQVASLSLLATPDDMVDQELEYELLKNAEVLNIVLRRDNMRELILTDHMPADVAETFDLRDAGFFELIWDALACIGRNENRVIRVIGEPVKGGGIQIEVTLNEAPLGSAMLAYGRNIFYLSLLISLMTATLLFFAVRRFLVKPMKRVVTHMVDYQENPEDAQRIITPQSSVSELMEAEEALKDMQLQLTQALKQKERLATLGGAVSRISHDLRNMLTTAQLLADRMDMSEDPAVKRIAPKVVGSLSRAINLCERTLAFGKAEEPSPEITVQPLRRIAEDVVESDRLRSNGSDVQVVLEIEDRLEVAADGEQLYRVLSNLIRNARQAIMGSEKPGTIRVIGSETDAGVIIDIADDGPGLPKKAQENIFQPFKGGARRGGTGLGLAIAAELVRGHGGTLDLVETSEAGTMFRITLPQRIALDV